MGGAIRLMEDELDKSLQWLVCLLHCNELPLRALLLHLDGKTAGPSQFKGPIGKLLDGCEKLPIVKFVPVKCIITDYGKILCCDVWSIQIFVIVLDLANRLKFINSQLKEFIGKI